MAIFEVQAHRAEGMTVTGYLEGESSKEIQRHIDERISHGLPVTLVEVVDGEVAYDAGRLFLPIEVARNSVYHIAPFN